MKKATTAIMMVFSFVTGAALMLCIARNVMSPDSPALRKAEEVYRTLDTFYIGEVDEALMCDTVAEAMVYATGDRWSYYIPASEYGDYVDQMQNAYVGIGITIIMNDDGCLEVSEVAPGGSALEAGMAVGDVFVAVDGESCQGQSITEVRTRVRGDEGTSVTITVRRGSQMLDLTMERRSIVSEVVRSERIGDVGYVAIYNFDATAADRTIEAVDALRSEGVTSLVFDVRKNPGGMKSELVRLLDYLLPEGDLFRSEDFLGHTQVDTSDAACVDLPMAVLIDQDSYSAAEFFAAALSEYGVAQTVGTQTCGKGYFQVARTLSDGSAINLSIGRYYTPNGVSLAEVGGLVPDAVVELSEEAAQALAQHRLAPSDDPQLQTALSLLGA